MFTARLHILALVAAAPALAAALQPPSPMPKTTRRVAIMSAPALALAPLAAHASYALGQAAVASHSWEATGKEKEKAVYESIEDMMEAKRGGGRSDTLLGGDSYTKKSAGDRLEWEAQRLEQQKQGSGSTGNSASSAMVIARSAARIAAP